MKKKIYLSIALVTISLFYSFSKFTSLSESNFLKTETFNPQDSFLLGSMHDYRDSTYIYLSDTLGFNFWHKYTIPKNTTGGWGWPVMGKKDVFLPADQLDTPVSRYVTDIRARLDTNNSNNLLTLLDRPKFEYLAFGQRSDYQCENISKVDPDYWFYTYYNSTDNGTTIKDTLDYSNGGSGYVKQCLYDSTNPGANAQMLFDSLRGNKEQINTYWPVTWLGDSHEPWYIMPRIRIDSAFANNPANLNIDVCKIIIKNRNGDSTTYTQVIKVKNFKVTDTSKYLGNYIDSFYTRIEHPIVNLKIPAGFWFNDSSHVSFGDQNCRVDFKVFWYDKCDMWIDRIRVENQTAHDLLTLQLPKIEEWIQGEVEDIAMAEINSGNQSPYKFYIEEFEFNHLPCIGYLNKKIKEYSNGRLSLMVNYNHDLVKAFIPNYLEVNFTPRQVKRYLIDSAGVREIFTICYNLEGWQDDEHQGGRESFVPTTLYNGYYEILSGLVVYSKSPSEYDDWIQDHFDNYRIPALNFKHIMEFSDSISKLADVPFNFMTQAHLWIGRGHMLKEPTNEEIALSTNLAISYGAKGIMYFAYGSTNSTYDTSAGPEGYLEVARGLTDHDDSPRRLNVYGQNKWEAIKTINKKIKRWDEHLMSFDTSRKSFILRSEYSNLYSQTYFSDVITYKPFGSAPPCAEDNPGSNPSGMVYECKEDRYLQVATFQNDEPNTNYFMVVNRRCSPLLNDSTNNDNNGGRRFVRIMLDSGSSTFSGFNNWSIYNVENDSLIKTFDKNTRADINLGWYLPGEGKLYKLAPVMQEGGTLVTNEDCSGTFDCKSEVNNNGFDINIRPGTTINFADSTAGIIMTGGDFRSGITPSENTTPVFLKGKNGILWKGIKLQECPSVEMSTTYFENISPYELDSTYAADIINCSYVSISSCSFISDITLNAGGVRAHYTADNELDNEVYVINNRFVMDEGDIPALSIVTSGYLTFPVIIEGNNFESYHGNSANAILLSGIEGGAIKSNTITDYKNGIIMIWSSMDFYGNIIEGGDDDSKGILSYASSYANLGPDGGVYTGGMNSIAAEGENAKCIETDNSFLYLDIGYNTFDLRNYDPGNAFHIAGTIPDEICEESGGEADATNNCFRVSGNDTAAVQNLECISMTPFNFNFIPYLCGGNPLDGMIVFDLGNGMYDTIYTESGGSGGGESNYELRIRNYELRPNIELITVKSLEDSVSINLRKRDYDRVSELCYELLTDHIDSLKDASIVSKLYLAELRLDSSGNRITNLKSFLESLILNNPEKETFVKQSFYVIQKCKVSLEMYESAMTGFQEIINQNPYSYEGLVASWDYAATSLLSGGQGGGERDLEFGMSDLEFENSDFGIGDKSVDNKSQIRHSKFQIFNDEPGDKYDPKKFTKEDRKVIKENIINSFQTSREIEIEKVKSLEKKVSEGNASKTERSELKVKKTLGEVIKVKKPRDITEHINNVNGNIQKVFGSTKDHNSKEVINVIPTEYSLSQNYPNPFNPVTKINFDLPHDGNVKLVIYDLLGREITRLLNNEFKVSGRYTVDFNGSNLSSGIYFYKIETDGFIATKKMMLLK